MLQEPSSPSIHLPKPLPSDLEQIVLKCLAKDPAERPPSASSLRASLLACEDASGYDRTAAFAWWREHRANPRTDAARITTVSPATMAVDFRGRSDPPAVATRAN